MAVKIAVTLEYEDEKRQFHLNRLLLFFVAKKLTALSDIFLTFGSYDCTEKESIKLGTDTSRGHREA